MQIRSRLSWLCALCFLPLAAQEHAARNPVVVDNDGTVHVPAQAVPLSDFLSPEAKAYVTQHLKDMQNPRMLEQENGVPRFMKGYLERQKILYPVDRQDTKVAGVHAYVYTPKAGIAAANRDRVLIDLHGGGFSGCWPACAELESIPIAALGRIRVVSLDYREGPQYKFPAASEDVASVYQELLKDHAPRNIGIYGCSAGGMLVAMSAAWFQKHHLPEPGAIGIFCAGAGSPAGAGFGGDATYTAGPLGEARIMRPPPAQSSPAKQGSTLGYLAGTDPRDPLVAPINSPEIMKSFPPSLIITATRGFEMSGALYTHTQLVKLGVEAELHVWDGLFHGFFYNPDVPESRDCYDVIVKFFAKHLGKS
ncbi:MAG TPA: alpha/beta hydrolase [Bryobacteraceae bacterium]|nr:alpha/beta hydrolase [Bryobacteraceae bacterium]